MFKLNSSLKNESIGSFPTKYLDEMWEPDKSYYELLDDKINSLKSQDKIVFDGNLLRLSSSIKKPSQDILVQPTSYYRSLITNHIPKLNSYSDLPFESSPLSNNLGTHILVSTADNHLILRRQGSKNVTASGHIIGTASGAVDLSDYDKGEDIRLTAIKTAKREFNEEIGIIPSNLWIDTGVIGIRRNPSRNGQPIFLMTGLVDLSIQDIIDLFNEANDQNQEIDSLNDLHLIQYKGESDKKRRLAEYIESENNIDSALKHIMFLLD